MRKILGTSVFSLGSGSDCSLFACSHAIRDSLCVRLILLPAMAVIPWNGLLILVDVAASPTQRGKRNRSSGEQSRGGIQKEYLDLGLGPSDDPLNGSFDGNADLFFEAGPF